MQGLGLRWLPSWGRENDGLDANAITGVLLGLLTAVFIGLFMVPRRHYKGDTATFLVGVTFGAALGNVIYWIVLGMPFDVTWLAAGSLLPGVNWAVGTFAYAAGTHRVGLAKATGIKNTQVVVATVGAFVIFGEARTTEPVLAFLGAGLVVATALALCGIRHRDEALPRASLKGYLVGIIASVLYGINGLLLKWLIAGGVPRPQMNLGIGLGAFAGGLLVYRVTKGRLDFIHAVAPGQHLLAIAGGLTWAAGLVTMIISIHYVGLAVAWSLLNLSIVIGVLYGTIALREVDIRLRWKQVAVGLVLACLGVLSLYLSKALPAAGG